VIGVGVLQLEHPDGQVFAFDPGSLAIAFVVTGAPGDDAWFETIHNASDLSRWAASVLHGSEVAATARDVAFAKRLRAAIWGAVEAIVGGRRPAAGDRRVINRAAAPTPMTQRLDPDGAASWIQPLRGRALLSSIARDAIDLLGGPRASRLKLCAGRNCSIPFVDTSRPGTRRWCSMERCGNRAKARTHYQQHRKEASR
jgi:predicted RNA-binding Zn ribbon-like protein